MRAVPRQARPMSLPLPDGPAQRLLAELPRRLDELRHAPGEYNFHVEDIREAHPYCPLGADDDVVYVAEILVCSRRGGGLGRALMAVLLGLADEHGVSVVLVAAPFSSGGGSLDQAALDAWYARLGFERWYNAHLLRRPRPDYAGSH